MSIVPAAHRNIWEFKIQKQKAGKTKANRTEYKKKTQNPLKNGEKKT